MLTECQRKRNISFYHRWRIKSRVEYLGLLGAIEDLVKKSFGFEVCIQ